MRIFKRASKPSKAVDPFREESSIGNILLRMKKISQEQLFDAVGMKARTNDHLLGALLVEMGAVSSLDVARALEIQTKLRAGDRVSAEMDLLDAVLAESAECNLALDNAIKRQKETARERGEKTGEFLRLAHRVA